MLMWRTPDKDVLLQTTQVLPVLGRLLETLWEICKIHKKNKSIHAKTALYEPYNMQYKGVKPH